jgi:hypothetical protein
MQPINSIPDALWEDQSHSSGSSTSRLTSVLPTLPASRGESKPAIAYEAPTKSNIVFFSALKFGEIRDIFVTSSLNREFSESLLYSDPIV